MIICCPTTKCRGTTCGGWRRSSVSRKIENISRIKGTFPGTILNGFAVLAMGYSGCNVTLAVFFLTLSLLMHGAVSSGALPSVVDISPNYASITLGIVSTIAIISGFVSPIIVGYITFENQSVEAWQQIFGIAAAMLIICGLIYVLFFDASIEPWNNTTTKSSKELEPLTKKHDIEITKDGHLSDVVASDQTAR